MVPIFRMVCTPGALVGAPAEWVAETLQEGEVSLLVDNGGFAAVNAAAHMLGQVTVSVVRGEETAALQEQTVIRLAGSLPVVWVGASFSASTREWARERGPMTLLIESEGPLPRDDCARIARFLALLGRQTE